MDNQDLEETVRSSFSMEEEAEDIQEEEEQDALGRSFVHKVAKEVKTYCEEETLHDVEEEKEDVRVLDELPSTSFGTREQCPPPRYIPTSDSEDIEPLALKRKLISHSSPSPPPTKGQSRQRKADHCRAAAVAQRSVRRINFTRSSSSSPSSPPNERKLPQRRLRLCPVPGCRSKPQVKLSNHLTYAHSGMSAAERQQALRNAKVVEKSRANAPGLKPLRGQATLEKTLARSAPPKLNIEQAKGSTRGFALREPPCAC